MSDEQKKKTLAEAVAQALQKGLSPELAEEFEAFVTEMQTKRLLWPFRRRLRVARVYLFAAYTHGTWSEGVALLECSRDELGGVLIGKHYYAAASGTFYFQRRTGRNGRGYEPKMKALTRTLQ